MENAYFYLFIAVFCLSLVVAQFVGYSTRYLLYPSLLLLFVAGAMLVFEHEGYERAYLVSALTGTTLSIVLGVFSFYATLARKAVRLTTRYAQEWWQGGFWGQQRLSITYTWFEVPAPYARSVWIYQLATYLVYSVCFFSTINSLDFMLAFDESPHMLADGIFWWVPVVYALLLIIAIANLCYQLAVEKAKR